MIRLAFLLVLPLSMGPALAHGGRYRVPATGQQPSPMAPGGFEDRTGATAITDEPRWSLWLEFNIDRLIDLRARLAVDPDPQSRPAGANWRPLAAADKTAVLLPPLLAALADKDAEVRASAAIALGKLAVPECLVPLRAAIGDRDRRVRESAALALGLTGLAGAEAPLLELVADSRRSETERTWAAIGLGYLGTEKAVGELLRRLEVLGARGGDRDGRGVLVACAAGLTVCRDARAAPRILGILRRAEGRLPPAQALLLLALAKLGVRDAVPVVTAALASADHIVRAGAAAAAGVLGVATDEALVEALCGVAASDPHPGVRAQAVIGLGRVGGTRAHDILRQMADIANNGVNWDLRPFAVTGLAFLRDKSDAPLLIAGLERATSTQKGAVAIALAILGAPATEKPVRLALESAKNPSIFAHAALAAGIMQAQSCVKLLRRTLAAETQIAEYRTAAAVALAMCGDRSGVQVVLRELTQPNPAGEQAPLVFAAYLLASREAVPALAALLARSDVQDRIRALCCAALGSIGDSRRHPVMSDLSTDFPMLIITEDLDRVLSLYERAGDEWLVVPVPGDRRSGARHLHVVHVLALAVHEVEPPHGGARAAPRSASGHRPDGGADRPGERPGIRNW